MVAVEENRGMTYRKGEGISVLLLGTGYVRIRSLSIPRQSM